MHRVRLFVLWIMMFAVPFQGYAAAVMVFCGPGHAGAVAETTAELSDVDVDGNVRSPHADGHGDHRHETVQAAKPSATDGTTTARAEPDPMHKCGICAACHATALTNTLALVIFRDLPHADLAEPTSTMASLVPRVLDKPPRA